MMARTSADITPGACSTTSNGPKATASDLASLTWTTRRRSARRKTRVSGTRKSPPKIECKQAPDLFPAYAQLFGAVRNFQAIALFRQLPLQGWIHQRNRNVHISNLELSWVERRISVLLAHVSRDRD